MMSKPVLGPPRKKKVKKETTVNDLLLSDGRMIRHVKEPIRSSTYQGQKEVSVLYKGFDKWESVDFDLAVKKFLEQHGFKVWNEGYSLIDNERELLFRVEE